MSDLTRFRDHCRTMEAAVHSPECEAVWHERDEHGTLRETRRENPNPHCEGCISDRDRTLWKRLADEVDRHLGT